MYDIKKNIIVICTHFCWSRQTRKDSDFMQPMAGLHIASLIDKRKYTINLYHEMYHGPFDIRRLEKEKYDLVFLTGLQKDFDRMRQLSYFFRKKGTLVIAGGSICTLFPKFSKEFFDVVCAGGVECVTELLRDYESKSVKKTYNSPIYNISDYRIDHSILNKSGIKLPFHEIEASRGCNFNCAFCTLPPENAKHAVYKIENILDNIMDSIKNSPFFSFRRLFPLVWFIDNNMAGNVRHLKQLCYHLNKEHKIKGWGALITQKTLQDRDLITLMRKSKCKVLFVGIESLDLEFLSTHNKIQNMTNVIKDIHFAQEQGIVVLYGYLFDPRIASIKKMKQEIDTLFKSPYLNFSTAFSFVSPLAGTVFFRECVRKKELLSNLRLRDLEGTILAFKPKDDMKMISKFANLLFGETDLITNRKNLVIKTIKHIVKYKYKNPFLWFIIYKNNTRLLSTKVKVFRKMEVKRNYIGGKDLLDPQYYIYPDGITKEDYRRYFEPIRVTDEKGNLSDWLKDSYR